MSKTAAINVSESDDAQEWETPPYLYDWICKTYNVQPILDPCATDLNHKCEFWFTKEQDGLNQVWFGNSFVNPEYRNVAKWIKKCYDEHLKNNITVIALVFSKTDTAWWHDYVEGKAEYHFIRGRVPFYKDGKQYYYTNKDGKLVKGIAHQPSVIIIWRSKK